MSGQKLPAYKSSDAILDYGMDWAEVLTSLGETIVSSVWEASLPLVISGQQIDGNITSCIIAGGNNGTQYKVYNTITTSGDFVDERYFSLKIQDIQVFV